MVINLLENLLSSDELELDVQESAAEVERENILVVDDEEIVRRYHINCLSPQYHCFEARSAEEAVEILLEKQISLVISDWVMGGMSGTTLMRKIIGSFPDVPVLMISGIDHPERALDTIRFGAFDYLIKPCKPEIIAATVDRALTHRRNNMEMRQRQINLELENLELKRINTQISMENLVAQ